MENITTCSNDNKKPYLAIKKLKVPMYSCEIQFIIADDINPVLDKIYKKFNIPGKFEGEAEGIVFSPDLDLYFILINKQYLSHNTIAHEIYHTTLRIVDDREIDDEEQGAWLNGWIAESMYKFLKKKNLEIK